MPSLEFGDRILMQVPDGIRFWPPDDMPSTYLYREGLRDWPFDRVVAAYEAELGTP